MSDPRIGLPVRGKGATVVRSRPRSRCPSLKFSCSPLRNATHRRWQGVRCGGREAWEGEREKGTGGCKQ
eukprot:3869888-Rhodomonas_salina.4